MTEYTFDKVAAALKADPPTVKGLIDPKGKIRPLVTHVGEGQQRVFTFDLMEPMTLHEVLVRHRQVVLPDAEPPNPA